MDEAISLENITKSFENNLILEDLNLKIVYGEVLCVSGRNGSGKSTLIRILSRLINPDSGNFFFSRFFFLLSKLFKNFPKLSKTFQNF